MNERIALAGKTVLEIGCDNGILLCLLASLHQEAHFVGIDLCSEAISVARERAAELGLSDIHFCVQSIDQDQSGKYDVILASIVFHEILAEGFLGERSGLMTPPTGTFSIEDADSAWRAASPCVPELRSIASRLNQDATLISVDRWRTDIEILRWVSVQATRDSKPAEHQRGRAENRIWCTFGDQGSPTP
jgi:2-polyprenyl-3-methyl-5-hydroxy-6-metoxy-1,4-benzoquinol methylase